MLSNNYFTISDFARLMCVSRQTLIYYDRIGLFRPFRLLDNGYRVYARSQINVFSLITMLTEMDVPLKEIRLIVDRISPDTAIDVLKKQRYKAQEQLRRLEMLENIIDLRIEQITLGQEVARRTIPPISIAELKENMPLYIGDSINCPWRKVTDEMIIDFYSKCEELGYPLIFSEIRMKSRENVLAGRTDIISNICFRLRDADGANAVIPRGSYAVGYVRGNCGDTGDVYRDMTAFIKKRKMTVVGDAYEEYLIDELAAGDPDSFVRRIMIRVGQTH